MFNLRNKIILITGGSGSWGQELTRQLLEKNHPKEIRIYSRGEEKQVAVKRKFQNPTLKFIIGDVRDLSRLKEATRGVDVVFHLAALKHVPVVEENPWEAVLTNIVGTQNVIEAAIVNNVKKVVDVSSDKACNPLSLYGTSKAVGEKLIIAANNLPGETSFVCVRAGNVLGTSGSVIPLFKEQIKKVNKISITDPGMSRYFMRLKDAIKLVIKATTSSIGGEIFVTKMPALKIVDLARVMISNLGNKKTSMETVGIRPGEKLFESLVSENEAQRAVEFDGYFVILPMIEVARLKGRYKGSKKVSFKEYTSASTKQLDYKEISRLLESDGWLEKSTQSEPEKYLDTLEKIQLTNFAKSEGWTAR